MKYFGFQNKNQQNTRSAQPSVIGLLDNVSMNRYSDISGVGATPINNNR